MREYDAALAAIQKVIDQLGSNPEWQSGAVLAYNAVAALQRILCDEVSPGGMAHA